MNLKHLAILAALSGGTAFAEGTTGTPQGSPAPTDTGSMQDSTGEKAPDTAQDQQKRQGRKKSKQTGSEKSDKTPKTDKDTSGTMPQGNPPQP